MKKLTSILVVVERGTDSQAALLKGYLLARHFNARLELFLCDAEHAYALRRTYDRQGVAEARSACVKDALSWLYALRKSVLADDISIEVDAACQSPLYKGIVQKVLACKPDLVVKSLASRGPAFSATDWELARTCPTALLFVRRRPWQPEPRFAAAVDLTGEDTPQLARSIVRTAQYLALGCGGTLEIFHGAREASPTLRAAVERLGSEYQTRLEGIHLVPGDPDEAVPAFARQQDYDVLVLGALTQRRALAALVGTLTDALAETVKSDLLLIKPAEFACPIAPADEEGTPAASMGPGVRMPRTSPTSMI